jgi:hypothetical protein
MKLKQSKNDWILRCDPLVSARFHRFSRDGETSHTFSKIFKGPTAPLEFSGHWLE